MKTQKFIRREFPIRAVQVTDDNFEQVARWCGGVIVMSDPRIAEKLQEEVVKFIKVEVFNPANERQTEAHVGDWVFKSGKTWKVYQNDAFQRTFMACEEEPQNQTSPKKDVAPIHKIASASNPVAAEQAEFAARMEAQEDPFQGAVGSEHS